ncbi:MAG: glycosyltransferase family 2 protein [bacterium]
MINPNFIGRTKATNIKISVIICTWNRAYSLKRTLDSIMTMSIPKDLLWELIVVDNNSTDNTKEIVKEYKAKSGLNIVYVFEEKRGLANARNRGIKEAKGEIIAFTDDDVIVDRNWLCYILKEFDSNESLSLLGGRVELYDPDDQPITIRTFNKRIAFSSPGQLFSLIPGCNMAFHRRVLDALESFDPTFGAGTRIKAAEDSDFFYRAYRMGFEMVYSPEILVYHNHGRRTKEQVRKLNKGYAIGRGAFYCKHILRGNPEVLKMALVEVISLIKGLVKNMIRLRSTDKQRMMLYALILGSIYRVLIEFRILKAS